jgi:putative nucleotidyltransferase with HDIG domain
MAGFNINRPNRPGGPVQAFWKSRFGPFGPRSLGAAQNKEFHVTELLESLKGVSQLFVDKSLADATKMIQTKASRFLERANRATTAEDQNYIIEIMLEAMGRHHPMTLVHQKEVARCTELIAKELNLTLGEMDIIKRAALLHDIGKLGEEVELLNNTDELTEKERAVIQQHVAVGALLLHEITWLKEESLPVYFSHYYKNYPTGINQQKAPLSARIIAVADSFNAMVSERNYQKPLTPWKAVHKLRRNIYDQKIVDVLGKILFGEKFEEIKLFKALLGHEINNALGALVIVQLYKDLKEDKNYKEFLSRFNEITLMVKAYIMGASDVTCEELLPSLEQKILSLKPVWFELGQTGKIAISDISDIERAMEKTLNHIRRYAKFNPIEMLILRGQTEQALAKFKLLPSKSRSKKLEEICQRQTERANESGGFKFGRPFVEFLIRIANDVELKEYPAIQDVVQKSRSSIKDQELIRQFKDLQ